MMRGVLNSMVLFTATDDDGEHKLWKSDGTVGGMVEIVGNLDTGDDEK